MITAKRLEALGACRDQIERFRELFGDGAAPLTVDAALSAAGEFDWDWDWAARNLLSAPARKLYSETCAPAWKLYDETCAPARKLYDETCARRFAELYIQENMT